MFISFKLAEIEGFEVFRDARASLKIREKSSCFKHKMVVKAFIKAQYAKNRIFTHFEAAVLEDPVSKNNFQASEVCKHVSNML